MRFPVGCTSPGLAFLGATWGYCRCGATLGPVVIRPMEFDIEVVLRLSSEGRAKLRHWKGREALGDTYCPEAQ